MYYRIDGLGIQEHRSASGLARAPWAGDRPAVPQVRGLARPVQDATIYAHVQCHMTLNHTVNRRAYRGP